MPRNPGYAVGHMQDNPFAPPSAAADHVAGRGLVFSVEGAAVVSSLAGWMRGLAAVYYVGLAFVAIGSCGAMFAGGAAGFGIVLVMLVVGAFLGVTAMWLRAAASDFERGVLSDDEFPLGQGFRSLRAYLILSGIISTLTLGWQIYQAVG